MQKPNKVNVSMLVSLTTSLILLPLNKRYHIWLGGFFVLLAAIHTWQHRRQLSSQLTMERPVKYLESLQSLLPPYRCARHLKHLQVQHYIPGRVRLYSHKLLQNQDLADAISA